jgi:FAD/FMN-containing dehydrogenase
VTEAPEPPGTPTRWRNWAGNERAVTEVVRPRAADEVASVLTSATASGRRVRPIGSGHSFSAIGVPEDVQLACDGLAGIGPVADDGVVTVGAGAPLHRLNAELVRHGWSLTNLGDIDRQTLAGALATGTHGTGAEFGGLATQVRALEIVTPDGEVIACDATRRPELFAAARIGLGALGVVTAVTLQAVPAFALRALEGPGTLTAALEGFE